MDATSISLCMDNELPIIVLNMAAEGAIRDIALGVDVGTRVGNCETVLAEG